MMASSAYLDRGPTSGIYERSSSGIHGPVSGNAYGTSSGTGSGSATVGNTAPATASMARGVGGRRPPQPQTSESSIGAGSSTSDLLVTRPDNSITAVVDGSGGRGSGGHEAGASLVSTINSVGGGGSGSGRRPTDSAPQLAMLMSTGERWARLRGSLPVGRGTAVGPSGSRAAPSRKSTADLALDTAGSGRLLLLSR